MMTENVVLLVLAVVSVLILFRNSSQARSQGSKGSKE